MMKSLIIRNVLYVFTHAHAKLRWGSLALPVGILGVLKLFHDVKELVLTPLYAIYKTGDLVWGLGITALIPFGLFVLQCRFRPQPDQPAGILLTAAEQQSFSRYTTRTLYAFMLWLCLLGCWGYFALYGDPAAEQKEATATLHRIDAATQETNQAVAAANERQKQDSLLLQQMAEKMGIAVPTAADAQRQAQEAINYEIVENGKIMLEQYLAQGGTLTALQSRSDGEGFYLLGIAKWQGWGGAAIDTKRALLLLERAVAKKFDRARLAYGQMLYYGVDNVPPEPERAVTYWQDCAAESYAPCAYRLATYYAYDLPPEKRNYDQARAYLNNAAAKGHIGALDMLGDFAWLGLGQKPNKTEAIKLYQQATAGCTDDEHVRCSASAANKLGYAHFMGDFVPQDYAKAALWYEKAAAQGDAPAQYNLGVMYGKGQGVPQDYAKAVLWYEKAAAQGHAQAQSILGVMYGKGLGVPQDYAKAALCFDKAAAQGDATAQYILGAMYLQSQGVPQDYAKALMWFEKAAAQGDAAAQYSLGAMYGEGQGVPQDYARAYMWTEKAAAQGHVQAQYNLGVMYGKGLGVLQDYAKAYMWTEKAAAQGDAAAEYILGVMYGEGRGVPQDYAKALMWFEKAAAQGDAAAQSNLGVMYAQGLGVATNLETAHVLFRLAATQQHEKGVLGVAVVKSRLTKEQLTSAEKRIAGWKPNKEGKLP